MKVTRESQCIVPLEGLFYGGLAVVVATGIWLAQVDDTLFRRFVQEDGVIESTSAFLLLLVSVFCLHRFFTLQKPEFLFKASTLGFALLFLFGAGEEISWGQRIFNWESSEFFKAHNAQSETNLHNMVIWGVKLNKLLFSKIFAIALILYFLVLPVLGLYIDFIREAYDRFFLPAPKWHHTAVFLVLVLLILLVDSGKKGELNEIVLAAIIFLTFLFPTNKHVFS